MKHIFQELMIMKEDLIFGKVILQEILIKLLESEKIIKNYRKKFHKMTNKKDKYRNCIDYHIDYT